MDFADLHIFDERCRRVCNVLVHLQPRIEVGRRRLTGPSAKIALDTSRALNDRRGPGSTTSREAIRGNACPRDTDRPILGPAPRVHSVDRRLSRTRPRVLNHSSVVHGRIRRSRGRRRDGRGRAGRGGGRRTRGTDEPCAVAAHVAAAGLTLRLGLASRARGGAGGVEVLAAVGIAAAGGEDERGEDDERGENGLEHGDLQSGFVTSCRMKSG